MVREGSPVRKRRRNRVPVSCCSCRALKTKCDGTRPVCSTCANNGRECVFVRKDTEGNANESYLRGLENRLNLLEQAALASVDSRTTRDQRISSREQATRSTEAVQPEPALSSVAIDGNLTIGGISFTQLLLDSVYGHGGMKAQSVETDPESRIRPLQLTEEELYATPDNAVDILNQYFTTRHGLTPVFHAPSALSVFIEALRCPAQTRRRQPLTFAIINMICALCTSHWVVNAEDNYRNAQRYYEIAMVLLQPTLLREWRLEHVQALLLGARYLQTTSRGEECWSVLGLAIRTAYGLCLHRDPPESDTPPVRETKRRVWYAAYMLDMHWSMIYHRPPATRSADFTVSIPEDLDDEYIRDDGVLYPMPSRPSNMSFFIEMVKLCRIMEKVLFRVAEGMEKKSDIAESIMTLDEDFQKWRRRLPAHLALDLQNPKEPQWILALRANTVRILIHRLSLSDAMRVSRAALRNQGSLASQTLQLSQQTCVDAAMESVDIVALRYEQTKQSLGLNWFNIYYLFNAIIVLVASVIHTANHQGTPALAKVEQALDMIKEMSSDHAFAKRASIFLQGLLQCMHQSLELLNSPHSSADSAVLANNPLTSSTKASMPMSLPLPLPLTTEAFPGLYTLFGYTSDIASNLEAQLNSFESGTLPESAWALGDLV
ncbi:hypothetical protein NW761_013776 [Fusarium oxysporum]|nr:hypothetical protein NW758_013513 [Fusarium oxysporum]KAJ4053270.1 hypothetical protein NW753_007445 [Fusarium oxysporum]KAJ4053936.1 hypothetical protein NW763_007486 [Fusarium oxysporum]KAJ4073045.1 hypothetical protein NW756_014388 [Fusarium oxysporum]KAJ4074560.1 hypothetical protein NW761_013776 [Fusarium oxysporum]